MDGSLQVNHGGNKTGQDGGGVGGARFSINRTKATDRFKPRLATSILSGQPDSKSGPSR